MLQGLLVLPIMTIIYISFARSKFTTRMWHLSVAGIVTIVSTFWWSVLAWLTPAANRPWVGSTSDNSIWSLIFGYNGFGRLLGDDGGPGSRPGGIMQMGAQTASRTASPAAQAMIPPIGMMGGSFGAGGPGGVGFGGETGVLRIFNESFGPNIAWLIPVALISAGLVIWLLRRAPGRNKERIGVLLWLGWLPIQLSSGQPVMAIGGFNGSDSTLTLSQLKQLVKQGKVRYYVVNSRQGKSGSPSGMSGPGGNSEILLWVKSTGSKVDYCGTQYTVYDLSAAA